MLASLCVCLCRWTIVLGGLVGVARSSFFFALFLLLPLFRIFGFRLLLYMFIQYCIIIPPNHFPSIVDSSSLLAACLLC